MENNVENSTVVQQVPTVPVAPVQPVVPTPQYQQPVAVQPTVQVQQPVVYPQSQQNVAYVQPQPVQQAQPAGEDMAAKLLQMKQLLDAGAITQEEYDAVKAKVLGL